MTESQITHYITSNFPDVHAEPADGNTFFFHGPERMFPIVTLVTNDQYDTVSNLTREGVYRLNIGISKETFKTLFGEKKWDDPSWDFTALDCLLPHPVYGMMYWVCVLSPSEGTFEKVKPLLQEAYDQAVKKRDKREATDGT